MSPGAVDALLPSAAVSGLSPTSPAAPAASTTAATLSDVRGVVASNADHYVSKLAEACAIPSVSAKLDMRDHCHQMADLLHGWIEKLGGTSEKVLIGFQELDDGTRYDLPPVILASFGRPVRSKPTLLVYAHYDVLDAEDVGEGADPFKLHERDGNLYARGAASNKGPLLAWLWAVDIYRRMGRELPVNLKFLFEGMQTCRSECLGDLLQREARRGGFLLDVNYAVVCDGTCLTGAKPCLTYGLRGLATFDVEVYAGAKALDAGRHAGAVFEPMTDLVQLLAAVSAGAHADVDVNGCGRQAADERTEAEDALYRGITFDKAQFQEDAGQLLAVRGGDDREVLMNRWRYPALSIHGIEPNASPGTIPGAAKGTFSLRLVPGQSGDTVEQEMRNVMQARFKALQTPNKLTVTSTASAAWLADPKGTLYTAGGAALLRVHGVRPDLIREGASMPVVSMLAECVGAELMLLPLGASDDGRHTPQEKIRKKQYLTAVTTLCTLLDEVATAHRRRDDVPKNRGALGRIRDIWYGLS